MNTGNELENKLIVGKHKHNRLFYVLCYDEGNLTIKNMIEHFLCGHLPI